MKINKKGIRSLLICLNCNKCPCGINKILDCPKQK
jgi:hypothetical protein